MLIKYILTLVFFFFSIDHNSRWRCSMSFHIGYRTWLPCWSQFTENKIFLPITNEVVGIKRPCVPFLVKLSLFMLRFALWLFYFPLSWGLITGKTKVHGDDMICNGPIAGFWQENWQHGIRDSRTHYCFGYCSSDDRAWLVDYFLT